MISLKKKGFNLVEIPSLIVVLLVLAIVLGLSGTILSNVRSTDTMSSTSTEFYANSTFTAVNATSVDFTPSAQLYDASGKAHLVADTCTGVKISLGHTEATANFTVSNCAATLNNINANLSDFKANFTYTYNTYNFNYNITTDGLNSTEDLSSWQQTWVVIISAAIVIGIVGKYLFFK